MVELTKRENKVAELVAKGYSEKEIATMLFLSTATVHNHTYNIRKKIGARSAVDIARMFILSLPDPKKILAASLLFLQVYTMAAKPETEFRRTSRIRIVRVKTNKKEA